MLNYSKAGKGNVLVLIHGFCENSTCFKEQVFFLSKDFTVITPDLPGFGNSAPVDAVSLEQMAEMVHEVLVAENVSSCIMLGHSMGGYVTLAYAELHPKMLRGFGLMHSTSIADTEERKQKRDQAIRVIEEKGMEKYVMEFVPPLFAETFEKPAKVNEMITEGLRTSAPALVAALLAMKQRPDRTHVIKGTQLPVFFAIGKLDKIIPETDMLSQAAMCRVAEICHLENSAHMGFIEEETKCNEAIAEFAHFASR